MIAWRLKSSGCRPIGLDIGNHSVKMIQLAVHGGHLSVLAAEKVRIEPDLGGDSQARRDFIVSAIKQMLSGGHFHGRSVVSALPSDKVRITSLRVAEAENEKIEQILRREMAQRFGLDADEDAVDYLPAGIVRHGDEIKNELILFATDSETVRSHIEMLEEARLRPVAIDTLACALFRNFERALRRQEDRERTAVFVDVGSRFTTVVFGRSAEISFVKQIPIGGEKFNREVASRLGVGINEAEMLRGKLRVQRATGTDAGVGKSEQDSTGQLVLDASTQQTIVDAVSSISEELAREISLCFRYYTVTFRGKRVDKAVIAGGEAYESILLNVLRRQLTVEIEMAEPLRGFDMMNVNFSGCKRDLLCEWAVAVGLSLKGWDYSSRPDREQTKVCGSRESDVPAEPAVTEAV